MNTKNILYNAALSGSLFTSTDENASFASMVTWNYAYSLFNYLI